MRVMLIKNPNFLKCKAIDEVRIIKKKNQEPIEIYHVDKEELEKMYKENKNTERSKKPILQHTSTTKF